MKDIAQICAELEALKALAAEYPDDPIAQASIAGQINVLEWVLTTDFINLSLTRAWDGGDVESGKPGDR